MIRRAWRSYRRLRLGTRLALGLGALSLVVFAVVGTALTAYMRDYLQHQLGYQMKVVQTVQAKDAAAHGTVTQKPYWGWFSAVYDVSGGSAVLRRPADIPHDTRPLTRFAEDMADSDSEMLRTVKVDG